MTDQTTTSDFFCNELSREANEQLFGTLARVDVWLLLEYNAPWGAQAFEESQLPPPVKAYLSQQFEVIPNSRLHFIKQPGRSRDGIAFYVALAREREPALYNLMLNEYDDLLNLDISTVVSDEAEAATSDDRLFLVCTNGVRDRCCAKLGVPVYRAMADYAGDAVWQTTHTGGHRFAANVLCFPHGIAYGHIGLDEIEQVVDSYHHGQLITEHYRGRSAYAAAVQAAEYYLRMETGEQRLDCYRLAQAQSIGENKWQILFEGNDDTMHRLHIAQRLSDFELYKSCGVDKLSRVPQHDLISYNVSDTV